MSQEHRPCDGPPTCPPSPHLDNIAVSQREGQFGLFLYAGAILQGHLKVYGHHLALEWAAGACWAWDQCLLTQQSVPCRGRGVRLGSVNTLCHCNTRMEPRPCASSSSALPQQGRVRNDMPRLELELELDSMEHSWPGLLFSSDSANS